MKIDDVQITVNIFRRLQKISESLHRLDELACNYELSEAQVKRGQRLQMQAEELAQELGLHAYNQGDPRGCSLYLVESLENADTTYNRGIAIY